MASQFPDSPYPYDAPGQVVGNRRGALVSNPRSKKDRERHQAQAEYIASAPVGGEYNHWFPDLPGIKVLRKDKREMTRYLQELDRDLAALPSDRSEWSEEDKYQHGLLEDDRRAVERHLEEIEEILPLVANPSGTKKLKARLMR